MTDNPRPLYICPDCLSPVIWFTVDREGRTAPTADAGKWRHAACVAAKEIAKSGGRRAPHRVEVP